ncbi:MAG TPA: hypothetical protein EYP19_01705, partial [Desulfobacterales bacterium]|nr:hypothetical protein [Desulfobacterales bacterium]
MVEREFSDSLLGALDIGGDDEAPVGVGCAELSGSKEEGIQFLLPSLLAREIIQGLQAYITTGFETPTPHFAGAFQRLVESPGQFYKGPYVSVSLPFRQGD